MPCNTRVIHKLICAAAIGLAVFPATAHAQRGHGRAVAVRPVFVAPYYSPFYDPFWGFYGWGFPGPYPSGFSGPGYAVESAARLQVAPRQTEVYVDGYRAGIADDFDGFSQRLRVAPGEHVIELYLDGHRSISQTILFEPGETYRIRHIMAPLPPGEAAPARPIARAMPAAQSPPFMYDAFGRPGPIAPREPAGVLSGASMLAIRVQPADAVVLVDGEQWQGSTADRLEIHVSPGPHRIEVRKDGYQPFTATVQSKAGETNSINISLTKVGN